MDASYILGDVGEAITANQLRQYMNIIRNVYLPINGRFTEIDMIGISEIGIFVIENKNYSGVVVGDITDKYWKVKYSGFFGWRLYNPVMQNKRHKEAVQLLLDGSTKSELPIFSPVIFNGKAKLNITNSEKFVFSVSSFIEAYKTVKLRRLSAEDVNELTNLFRLFSDQSYEAKAYYVQKYR